MAQNHIPGVSVSQVGRRYDVNAILVFTWRCCDPRYRPAACDDTALSFLPVEVVGDPSPRPVAAGPSDGRSEIALSNGHQVNASGSFGAEAWCCLVRVLGG